MKWKKCLMNIYNLQVLQSYSEKDETFDISELIEKIIKKYNNDNISIN